MADRNTIDNIDNERHTEHSPRTISGVHTQTASANTLSSPVTGRQITLEPIVCQPNMVKNKFNSSSIFNSESIDFHSHLYVWLHTDCPAISISQRGKQKSPFVHSKFSATQLCLYIFCLLCCKKRQREWETHRGGNAGNDGMCNNNIIIQMSQVMQLGQMLRCKSIRVAVARGYHQASVVVLASLWVTVETNEKLADAKYYLYFHSCLGSWE